MHQGDITLVISELLIAELEQAPAEVQEVLPRLPAERIEHLTISEESERLRNAYLNANVADPASFNDAHHVALAFIAKVDYIVSWNFKHLVHVDKIRGFNSVNLRQGYALIDIRTPKESGINYDNASVHKMRGAEKFYSGQNARGSTGVPR